MNTFTAQIMKTNFIILAVTTAVMLASCGKKESPSAEKAINTPSEKKLLPEVVTLGYALPPELKGLDLEKSDPDDLTHAVKQIGLTKRVEAVPFLIANIARISPVYTSSVFDYSQTYPCSAVLIEIGEPAVPQIQARLLTTGKKIELRILLSVFCEIKGSKYVAKWLDTVPTEKEDSLLAKNLHENKGWVLSLNYEPQKRSDNEPKER